MESILGICGGIGHGKDTAADFLVAEAGYRKLSLAYPLKVAVRDMFGLEDRHVFGTQADKAEVIDHLTGAWTGRALLELMGTDVCRRVDPDIWVNKMFDEIRNTPGHIVIPDVRFQNECNLIQQMGGQVIKVTRRGHEPTGTEHASGQWVSKADNKVDRVIDAGSVAELQVKVAAFCGIKHP